MNIMSDPVFNMKCYAVLGCQSLPALQSCSLFYTLLDTAISARPGHHSTSALALHGPAGVKINNGGGHRIQERRRV